VSQPEEGIIASAVGIPIKLSASARVASSLARASACVRMTPTALRARCAQGHACNRLMMDSDLQAVCLRPWPTRQVFMAHGKEGSQPCLRWKNRHKLLITATVRSLFRLESCKEPGQELRRHTVLCRGLNESEQMLCVRAGSAHKLA